GPHDRRRQRHCLADCSRWLWPAAQLANSASDPGASRPVWDDWLRSSVHWPGGREADPIARAAAWSSPPPRGGCCVSVGRIGILCMEDVGMAKAIKYDPSATSSSESEMLRQLDALLRTAEGVAVTAAHGRSVLLTDSFKQLLCIFVDAAAHNESLL